MKKLIALLLALMLALALAVPASAAGEDIGIIGGADGPTYILVSADPKAAATVSKEQREQNIKALGGVAGQVNVLLGDRCIAFTDAVPEVKNGRTMVPLRAALEAMGARIEFDQATKTAIVTGEKASFTHVVGSDVITRADGSTVKMDVHSYVTPSNRTMVPVRFFSQVLGYDVFWDNGYRMAFLLDGETFAEKVDSRLTILNGADAREAISLAEDLGMPTGNPIYFCIDTDVTKSQMTTYIVPYVQGILSELEGSGYKLGIYGPKPVCKYIRGTYSATERYMMICDNDWGQSGWSATERDFDDWNIRQYEWNQSLPGVSSVTIDKCESSTNGGGGWKL